MKKTENFGTRIETKTEFPDEIVTRWSVSTYEKTNGFVAIKEFTLQTGEEVLLKTTPVDPRDLFRGDYVILNYEISRLNLDSLETDTSELKGGDRVFVALDIADGHGTAKGVFRQEPPEGLVTVRIDPATGLLAGSGQRDAIFETFMVESVPTKTSRSTRSGCLDA